MISVAWRGWDVSGARSDGREEALAMRVVRWGASGLGGEGNGATESLGNGLRQELLGEMLCTEYSGTNPH